MRATYRVFWGLFFLRDGFVSSILAAKSPVDAYEP